MARYMNSDTDDRLPVYSLYAVVVHHDVMNAAFSGHYVCYVKDTQGKWFKADDSQVCFSLSGSHKLLYFIDRP
jgi:ubiquitin carboxyl-terminal hydrolase 36/42